MDSWPPIEQKDTPTIDSPVAYGILVIRILVRNNGADLAEARQLLDGCDLTEVKCRPHGDFVQPLSLAMFPNLTNVSNATTILELTARTLDACPPVNITNTSSVVRELRAAGVYGSSYHSPADVNLTAASVYALTEVFALLETGYVTLNNGWLRLASQGLFGSDYISRAYASYSIPFGLVSSEVLYVINKKGTLSLSNDEAYLYTFSSKPPLGPTGFWSLTMYNTQGTLVTNPEDVYAVGDRSNITYPDGTLVYGTNSNDSDGTFQVLVQSSAVPPPANWTKK